MKFFIWNNEEYEAIKNIFFLLFFCDISFAQLQQLRVSENRHYLVMKDGKPFFWLGDTGWELFHRLNKQDAELYFKNDHRRGLM